MCCEQLVCARCAGPVADGRCPTCRAARDGLHHGPPAVPPLTVVLIAILVALAMLAAVAMRPHLGG